MSTTQKSEQSDERMFTAARQAQGFTSQAQLDAFYRQYDHDRHCPDCKALNGWVELSEGMQPTQGACPIARELDRAYFATK